MSVNLVSITHPSLEKEMTPEEFIIFQRGGELVE